MRFLSPYEPSLPVTDSRFHGRSSELNLILTHQRSSFAIEGGRRIGKTSLLMEVKRLLLSRVLTKEQAKRVVWFDFWGYNNAQSFFEEVVRHFGEGYPKLVGDFASYFPRFVARMRGMYGGPILFVFDEVDDLIEHERKTGCYLLGLLRRAAHVGDCVLLVAGFRKLSEELNRHDTALSFCERVRLQNLTREQTMTLLKDPMASMGVRLERDVFPQILSDTGGHPQLVQFYGQALIEILDATGQRTVSLSHVRRVKSAGRLYDKLVEMLLENTDDLEFALVYSLADCEEFSFEEVDNVLAEHDLHLPTKRIHGICRRLEGLGVISRKGYSNTYQFAIPLQPALVHKLAGPDFVWRKACELVRQEGVGA